MHRRAAVRTELVAAFRDVIAPGVLVSAMPGAADIGGGDSAGWGKGLAGPVWLPGEGGVLFSDMGHHRRILWVPGETPRLAGCTSGAIGGTAVDAAGRLLGCDWSNRRIVAQDGDALTVLADGFASRSLNRPHAICTGSAGEAFFVDTVETFPPVPAGVVTTGRSAIYRIAANGVVEDTGILTQSPGGLAFDARGMRLLVGDLATSRIEAYPVDADGVIDAARGTTLATLDGPGKGLPHALALDGDGRIYAGGPGGVWVLDAAGVALGVLHLPTSRVTGLAIGGGRLWISTAVGIACVALGARVGAEATMPRAPAILSQPLGFDQAVRRHHPALDRIIAPDAQIATYAWGEFFEDLGGGANYLAACSLEGLIWDSRQQALLFSDIGNDRRIRLTPQTGAFTLANAPTGNTNGATFDADGNILSCEQGARRVTLTMPNGARSVVVDRTNDGRRLNCPNDITMRSDGHIYFTDPFWNFGDGRTSDIGHAATWHLAPDGTLTEFGGDWIVCNGLALSVDERTLFVNDSYGFHIRAFDLRADGSVDGSSARIHCELKGAGEGKPDGMKLDVAGNIYCGGPGGLWVMDPDGRHLGTIDHGATQTNNLIFGGRICRELFFCSWMSMHSIRTLIPGVPTLDARNIGRGIGVDIKNGL